MLPSHPLLASTPLRSTLNGVEYHPDTLLLKHDGVAILGDGLSVAASASLTHWHELLHWFQHHATSFGCLLSILRYSQYLTVIRSFQSVLDLKSKKRLCVQRNSGTPMVGFEDKNKYLDFESYGSSNDDPADVFRQIWYDHLYVAGFLLDGPINNWLVPDAGTVFGEVFADLLISCEQWGMCKYAGHNVTREAYSFNKDQFELIGERPGVEISTRSIMEAAALATEINAFKNYSKFASGTYRSSKILFSVYPFHLADTRAYNLEELAEKQFKSIWTLGSEYGAAFRAFLASAQNLEDADQDSLLRTLCIVCDAALNPPVPPLIVDLPDSWAWQLIYPPARFRKLLTAVQKRGLLSVNAWSHEGVVSYQRELSDLAEIPMVERETHPYASKHDFQELCQATENSRLPETLKGSDYFEYVCWLQSKLLELRHFDRRVVIDPGSCVNADELPSDTIELLLGEGEGRYWASPQLFHAPGGQFRYHGKGPIFSWILVSLACRMMTTEWMAGVGQFDVSKFPAQDSAAILNFSTQFYQLITGDDVP